MSTPETLTADEAHLLLDELLDKSGTSNQIRRGIRNYTLALIMLDAGLRCTETISLKVSDLIFNNTPVTSLLVRPAIAKNHKERIIAISDRLFESLEKMNEIFWGLVTAGTKHFAFTGSKVDKPLTRRQAYKIISSAAIAALGRPVNPHMLRHTFASKLMRVTSMRTVQELLGHSDIASTQIYTHPNADDKKTAIAKMDHTDGQ